MPHEGLSEHDTMRLRALESGLRQSNTCVLHQDRDLVYDLVENLPDDWPARALLGESVARGLSEAHAQGLLDAQAAVLTNGHQRTLEVEIRQGLSSRLFEVIICPDTDADGAPMGILTTLKDITEWRERERAMTSLMREVSHRSKNLLAIVQSVAMQTARHSSGSIENFLDKFRGRLHALSSTQDLVTESDWRGTLFRALVHSQVARVGQPPADALRIEGEDPMLGPNAALHVGLAIHELVTNASLHGALSREGAGRVIVRALFGEEEGKTVMIMEWDEETRPGREEQPLPRFGTLVLERIVPLSVGGHADYRVAPGRIGYRLVVPAGQFEK
ncbi:histidine kinase [Arsenicitalea aurantiaca]|uniref:histidine kinase n=1 Tax=Arsenicitalea aurantiaca TaxID=1783274 RepID=A0A433XLF3_9HYPH|nr:PAS domain-containing sensor histidine kinase [Arsenicitalea aurantiaca]RUT34891.1 histidine kinase [Arsenicitalea aurantiaca]